MSLVVPDRLSRRRTGSRLTAEMLRQLSVIGGSYGKRVLAVPGGAAGAAAAAAAAVAMGKKKAKVSKSSKSQASSAFNPGSSGGFVTKTKRPKKSRKALIKARSDMKFKRRIREVSNKETVAITRMSYIFPIQTSTSFPCVPVVGPYLQITSGLTTAGPLPNRVGWNMIECPTLSDLHTRMIAQNAPLRSEPWVTDAVNIIRRSEPNDDSFTNGQYTMCYDLNWKFELRNNSNSTAKVTIYVAKCRDTTGQTPLTELDSLRQKNYVNTDSLSASPPDITRDFEQYYKVKMSGERRLWNIHQEFTAVLNPGDTCSKNMSYSCELPWRTIEGISRTKGSWAVFARIEGTLAIDRDNPSLYDYVGAVVGCHMSRKEHFAIRKSYFDRKYRIGPTASGTLVNPVIAMDATQEAVEE